jgi:dipeptidyl aminopeptidase/acylaminoacyl peptidase
MGSLAALLSLRAAFPLDVSRDGETVLVGCDAAGTTQLYRLPAGGGALEQLTDFTEPVDGRFLRDGRVLLSMDAAGNERAQLYVLPGPEPLVVEPDFIHWTPQLSRDGTLLAYASNRGNGRDFDVYVRELASGEERRVFGGGWCEVASFSPGATRLAVTRSTERSGDNELWLVELGSGETTEVLPHEEEAHVGAPAWLDEERFLVATDVGRDVAAVLRETGEVVLAGEWELQCWADPSGRVLLVEANEDGYSRLELRDAATLELRALVPLPGRGVVEHPVFSDDGSRLWFAFSSPTRPSDVWLWDDELRQLTDAGAPADLREPELHRFASFDGVSVPVFLWEPEGEGPFPVVVTVHGGPEWQYRPAWMPTFTPLTQHLLARGYAVAAPNIRGSTGYGRRYEHLDDCRLRLDSVRDLAALHDWLSARPRIDGSRAVLYGRSYGGYMVLAGLAFQPERWAAGIESVGISNLVTFLENTSDWRRRVREREYGFLDGDRDFLVEASPLTHVDRMRAPLFVQHGANDPRVPLSETEQIHRVLTSKGIRCDLLVHEDEGHAIGKLGNRVETFERAVAFLDDVLR